MSQDKQFYSTFFVIMGALVVLMVVLIIIATNLTSDVAEYKPEEIVLENIKPVGAVNVAGESAQVPAPATSAAAETAVAEAPAAAAKSGEDIYKTSCMACHAAGVANAPKFGDAAAWAPRIANGMDALMANAIKGLNAMPPKGTCMTCSDDDLRAAIQYMVDNSQ